MKKLIYLFTLLPPLTGLASTDCKFSGSTGAFWGSEKTEYKMDFSPSKFLRGTSVEFAAKTYLDSFQIEVVRSFGGSQIELAVYNGEGEKIHENSGKFSNNTIGLSGHARNGVFEKLTYKLECNESALPALSDANKGSFLKEISSKKVLLVGEIHDDTLALAEQTFILDELIRSGRPLIMTTEMLMTSEQKLVDEYLASPTDRSIFSYWPNWRSKTGFWNVLSWAKLHNVKVLAADHSVRKRLAVEDELLANLSAETIKVSSVDTSRLNGHHVRDSSMANTILSAIANGPADLLVIHYSGSYHTLTLPYHLEPILGAAALVELHLGNAGTNSKSIQVNSEKPWPRYYIGSRTMSGQSGWWMIDTWEVFSPIFASEWFSLTKDKILPTN